MADALDDLSLRGQDGPVDLVPHFGFAIPYRPDEVSFRELSAVYGTDALPVT